MFTSSSPVGVVVSTSTSRAAAAQPLRFARAQIAAKSSTERDRRSNLAQTSTSASPRSRRARASLSAGRFMFPPLRPSSMYDSTSVHLGRASAPLRAVCCASSPALESVCSSVETRAYVIALTGRWLQRGTPHCRIHASVEQGRACGRAALRRTRMGSALRPCSRRRTSLDDCRVNATVGRATGSTAYSSPRRSSPTCETAGEYSARSWLDDAYRVVPGATAKAD